MQHPMTVSSNKFRFWWVLNSKMQWWWAMKWAKHQVNKPATWPAVQTWRQSKWRRLRQYKYEIMGSQKRLNIIHKWLPKSKMANWTWIQETAREVLFSKKMEFKLITTCLTKLFRRKLHPPHLKIGKEAWQLRISTKNKIIFNTSQQGKI